MTLRTGNKRSNALITASSGRAFTLVELMLVMTLLIIVISISAPTLGNFFRGRSLDSEARRLLALTRHGQSRAVSEGVPMLLWVDEKDRTYGLEEESGYTDLDTKSVEFTLEKDLEIEVISEPLTPINPAPGYAVPGLNNSILANARAQAVLAQSRSIHKNFPAIRFQPDGSISETSPRSLRLVGREKEKDILWVEQSRSRLCYEIQQTNHWLNR